MGATPLALAREHRSVGPAGLASLRRHDRILAARPLQPRLSRRAGRPRRRAGQTAPARARVARSPFLASKRDQIKMSSEEVASFLSSQRVMIVAALGRDGWPHLTALWFVMRDGEPWI